MPRQTENELLLEEKHGTIYLVLRLTFRRRTLWILIALLSLAIAAIGSTLNDEARNFILEFIFSAMQLILFEEWRLKS